MSAGNSFEEAMVQGMSEIIERYVQKKIIKERISLPDIPVEYIKKYPHIYEMFRKLEQKQRRDRIFYYIHSVVRLTCTIKMYLMV